MVRGTGCGIRTGQRSKWLGVLVVGLGRDRGVNG